MLETCLLCGAEPDVMGIFVPKDPERRLLVETRASRYWLCRACFALPGKMELAERRLIAARN